MVDSLIVLHRQEDLAEFFKPDFVIKDFVMAGLPGAPATSNAPIVFSAATGLTLKSGGHDLNGTPLTRCISSPNLLHSLQASRMRDGG